MAEGSERAADLYHDLKEDSKRRKAENLPRRRCWDWMIVSGTHHYARNRSSFTSYRSIQATAQGAPVVGIGTVELRVKRQPGSSDVAILRLHNVLHLPEAPCNGFCFTKGCVKGSFDYEMDKDGTRGSQNGSPLWYGIPFRGLNKLALADNPQGESYLTDGPKMPSLYVSKAEAEHLQQFLQEDS